MNFRQIECAGAWPASPGSHIAVLPLICKEVTTLEEGHVDVQLSSCTASCTHTRHSFLLSCNKNVTFCSKANDFHDKYLKPEKNGNMQDGNELEVTSVACLVSELHYDQSIF